MLLVDGYEFYAHHKAFPKKCMQEDCTTRANVEVFAARRSERMLFCTHHAQEYFPEFPVPKVMGVRVDSTEEQPSVVMAMGYPTHKHVCMLCEKE